MVFVVPPQHERGLGPQLMLCIVALTPPPKPTTSIHSTYPFVSEISEGVGGGRADKSPLLSALPLRTSPSLSSQGAIPSVPVVASCVGVLSVPRIFGDSHG